MKLDDYVRYTLGFAKVDALEVENQFFLKFTLKKLKSRTSCVFSPELSTVIDLPDCKDWNSASEAAIYLSHIINLTRLLDATLERPFRPMALPDGSELLVWIPDICVNVSYADSIKNYGLPLLYPLPINYDDAVTLAIKLNDFWADCIAN